MEDQDRIESAKEDITEWFDWNRHRMTTVAELAQELELPQADVEQALSVLVADGHVEQNGKGYHRAVKQTTVQS
jgi:DNA-binding IclR family transcriptional regulator